MAKDYSALDHQFYPTPPSLCQIIVDKYLKNSSFSKVLEPSAGKGDFIKNTINCHPTNAEYKPFNFKRYSKVYALELDDNLHTLLTHDRSINFRMLGKNFLQYSGFDVFSLILMNPPFLYGVEHLNKALDIAEGHDTKVVCILNAETIKNPNTLGRQQLIKRLNKLDAEIDFYQEAFATDDSERNTNVEVAIIHVKCKRVEKANFDEHFKAFKYGNDDFSAYRSTAVAITNKYGDTVSEMIEEYNDRIIAMKESIKRFNQYNLSKDINLVYGSEGTTYTNEDILPIYVENLRKEYWNKLVYQSDFSKRITESTAKQFKEFLSKNDSYEFCEENIDILNAYLMEFLVEGIEESIEHLFDQISGGGYYRRNGDYESSNVHLYNGWVTNNLKESEQGFKLNNRCILQGYNLAYTSLHKAIFSYDNRFKIMDIERVIRYFDSKYLNDPYIVECGSDEDTNKYCVDYYKSIYENEYIRLQLYMKGTLHVKFLSEKALDRFNTYIGLKKNWLPPSYGKAYYEDMPKDEQLIIDQFEGKKAYNTKVDDPIIKSMIGNTRTQFLLGNL